MNSQTALRLRHECAARVTARRWPETESTRKAAGFMGADLVVAERRPGYMPPATLAEWLDDRIANYPWCGDYCAVLFDIAEAARAGGEKAALAALAEAKKLDLWHQYRLYQALNIWKNADAFPAGQRLMSRIMDAWTKARLTERQPQEPEVDVRRAPEPKRPEIEYETELGNPAGRRPWAS